MHGWKGKRLDVNCLRWTLHSDVPLISALNPRAHPNLLPDSLLRVCGYPLASGRLLVRAFKQVCTVKNVNVSQAVEGVLFYLFDICHNIQYSSLCQFHLHVTDKNICDINN